MYKKENQNYNTTLIDATAAHQITLLALELESNLADKIIAAARNGESILAWDISKLEPSIKKMMLEKLINLDYKVLADAAETTWLLSW